MTTGTRVRDWATVDYYAVLGVPADATPAEISQEFRTRVKRLHPDAGLDDPAALAEFHDITAAYEVLGDPRTRRDYDAVRSATTRPAPAPVATGPTVPATAPTLRVERKPWTARRAWTVLVVGVVLTVIGLGVAVLTWALHAHDADLRSRFTPVTAMRVDVDGQPFVRFRTADGEVVQVAEPRHHGDPVSQDPTVVIRYDPDDPTHVVPNAGTGGRDITLAIVALKFLVGGPVFAVVAARRLRAARTV
jgi:hypothetical protein